MERIVGLALARYLGAYVVGEIKFHDWSLHDLEFKVDVIQDLIGIPPNVVIKRASCNKMWAKIPWYKLGHDPILLVAETVEIELEEPLQMTAPKPHAPKPAAPITKKQAPGFTDRVIDNIKFQIGEVKIRLQTLGKVARRRKARPPVAVVRIRDIEMLSTNAKWEVADLKDVHKVNAMGHVLLYRLLKVGRTSAWLEVDSPKDPESGAVVPPLTIPILTDVPINIRLKTKKEYFGGPLMNVELDIEISEVIASLNRSQFKSCQRLLDAVLECLYRQIDVELNASSHSAKLPSSAPRSRKSSLADIKAVESTTSTDKPRARSGSGKRKKSKKIGVALSPNPSTTTEVTDTASAETGSKPPGTITPSSPAAPAAPQSGWFGRLSSWYYASPAKPISEGDIANPASISPSKDGAEPSSSDASDDEGTDEDGEFYSGSEEDDGVEESNDVDDREFHDVDETSKDVKATDVNVLVPPQPEEAVPDEEGVPFEDEEDVIHTAYHLHIIKGRFDIHDEEPAMEGSPSKPRGLTRLSYEDFEVHLVPSVLKLEEDGYVTAAGSNEPLSRAEIEVIVGLYTLALLDPPNDRHPGFTSLVQFSSFAPVASEVPEPMLHATFIKRPKKPRSGLSAEALEKLGYFSKELQLVFNHCEIVFDADIWERLYCFFFSGAKGRKFERYVGSNLEFLVEAALEGYFNFRLSSQFARVVLPPFAGHHGHPHVASQVLRLHMNDITVSSAASSTPTPDVFRKGIFVAGGTTFPARNEDLSAALLAGTAEPEPFASQKFEISVESISGVVQATPDAPQRSVLQPMDVKVNVFLHDFVTLPKHRPHLEMFLQTSRVIMTLTQTQYQYFFTVFSERVRWDPHRHDSRHKNPSIPKPHPPATPSALTALESFNADSSTPSVNSPSSPTNQDNLFVSHTLVNIIGATLTLVDEEDDSTIPLPTFPSTPPSHPTKSATRPLSVLASLELDNIEFVKENLVKKTVAKVSVASLIIRDSSGEETQSPFAVLVAPVANTKITSNGGPMLLARWESPWIDVPSLPSSELWLQFRGAQVCWIYSILAKLQLFFTSEAPPSPHAFDSTHVAKFLEDQGLVFNTQTWQSAAPSRMNWQIAMNDCEALVVESPSSPECLPMAIHTAKFTRVSPHSRRVIYHFLGDVKFFSLMWNSAQKQLTRTALTEPFTLDTIYASSRIDSGESVAPQWRSDFIVRIPELFVSITHAQYIMLLSALDSQLTDLRAVSATRAKKESQSRGNRLLDDAPSSLAELLTYRFNTEIERCSISFSQTGVPFARLDMKALHYITEDWTSKYKMYIGGDDVRLVDLTSTDSTHFKSILHNRLAGVPSTPFGDSSASQGRPRVHSVASNPSTGFLSAASQIISVNDDFNASSPSQSPYFSQMKRGKGKERDRQHANSFGASRSEDYSPLRAPLIFEDSPSSVPSRGISVPPVEGSLEKTGADKKRLLNVKNETIYLPPEALHGDRIASQSHWIIELNPVELIYVPEIVNKLQEFFSWMEEHQNLRKAYQSLRSRVAGYWSKERRGSHDEESSESLEVEALAAQLRLMQRNGQQQQQRDVSTLFHLVVHNPVLLLPERISATRSRVLSCDLGGIEVTHETTTKLLPPPVPVSASLPKPSPEIYRDSTPSNSPRLPQLENISSPRSPDSLALITSTTAVNVNALQMKLILLQSKTEPDLLTPSTPSPPVSAAVSSARVLDPVSFSLFLNRKSTSFTEVPFLHVEARLDQLVARVSIERFKTVLGIVQAYLVRSVGDVLKTAPGKTEGSTNNAVTSPRLRTDADTIPESKAIIASAATSSNESNLIDVVMEFNCKRISLAVVSDYEEELDLFYAYFKDMDAHVNMFSGSTQVSLMLRFESLINDLNFMTPEKFIDPVNLALNFRMEHGDAQGIQSKAKKFKMKNNGEDDDDDDSSDKLPREEVSLNITDTAAADQDLADESVSDDDFYDTEEVQEKMSIELVVLDQIHVEVKKDLIRQLMEIYNLAVMTGKDSEVSVTNGTTSGMSAAIQQKSHFQYILDNSTEANILYGQPGTLEKKMLAPGQRVPFSFANPYLPKLLEFALEGWTKPPGQYRLDEPGRILLNFTHETIPEIERELMLVVKPGGLKRFVEFKALHRVRNLTDQPLELVSYWQNHAWNKALKARSYIVAPSAPGASNAPVTFTPILARGAWGKDMLLAVRFNSDPLWQFSEQFVLKRNEFVEKLSLERSQVGLSSSSSNHKNPKIEESSRSLFLSVSKDDDGMVTLTFSPPLLLVNLAVFPLDYSFASPLLLEGQCPPLSTRSFYIDTEKSSVYLKLDGFSKSSSPIAVNTLAQSTVDNQRDHSSLEDDEKATVTLNVITRPALLGDEARVMFVNTQFLFVNDTDLLLFIQQRGAGQRVRGRHRVTLAPRARAPFSWYPVGARQIHVKVGDTSWSKGLNVTKPAVTKLSVAIAELGLVYDLVMEVKQADAYSRIVIFRPCLHVTNRSNRDLVLDLDCDLKKSALIHQSSFSASSDIEATALNTALHVKCGSRADSAICPDLVRLRFKSKADEDLDEFTATLPLTQAGLFTVKLETKNILRRSSAAIIAFDVDVIINAGGTFVTLRENRHPPYLLHNNTPFILKFRPKTPVRALSASQSDVVIVRPHSTLPFFDERLPDSSSLESLRAPLEFLVAVDADVDDNGDSLVTLDDDEIIAFDPSSQTDTTSKGARRSLFRDKDHGERDRKVRHLERHFSRYRRTWSAPFDAKTVGIQRIGFHVPQHLVPSSSSFIIDEDDEPLSSSPSKRKRPASLAVSSNDIGNEAQNSLTLAVTQQGATKHLSFALSSEGDDQQRPLSTLSSAGGAYLSLVLRVPRVEIALLDDLASEVLFATLLGLDVEVAQLRGTSKQFVYAVLRDMQIDAMHSDSEHPVLLQTDWRKLTEFDSHHYVRPNLLELLYEWSAQAQDNTIFVEYFGVRALPTSVKLDGHVLLELRSYADLFNTAAEEQPQQHKVDQREEDMELQQHRVLAQYAAVAALPSSNSRESEISVLDDEGDDATTTVLSVGRVDVFPLEVSVSVGRNALFYPVITEALVQLRSFQRAHLSGSSSALLRSLTEDYIGQAWSELYKVIIDLDVIASPVQQTRKMVRGLREFILFPIESLVFDDTPGAFIFGLLRGLRSLLLNSSDVFLTLFMKFSGTIAWLLQQATLDPEFQEVSAQRARRHPRGAWEGFVQAFMELGRAFYSGLTGLGVLPYRGARENGFIGFAKGLGRALLGLPLKPMSGFFEFQRIFYDGILHTLGRGTHIDQRWHALQSRDFAARYGQLFTQWLPHPSDFDISATVRLVSDENRVKERFLVFSRASGRLLVFNTRKLADVSYAPRVIPLAKIFKVLRPVIPETTFLVVHKSNSFDLERLQFVAPDRELFIQALEDERVLVEDVDKNWRNNL